MLLMLVESSAGAERNVAGEASRADVLLYFCFLSFFCAFLSSVDVALIASMLLNLLR